MAVGSLDHLLERARRHQADGESPQIVLRPGQVPVLLRPSYYDRDADFPEQMYAPLPHDSSG